MYKICKTEKSLARQRELEEGFLHHLETASYFETDISKICRYLNIPRKTFYRYFDSKEDILHALIDHRLWDMDRRITQSDSQLSPSLRQDAFTFFLFWKDEQRFLDVLCQNHLLPVVMMRVCSQDYSFSRGLAYIDRGSVTPNLYVHNFLMSGAMSLVFQWHKEGYQKSIEELSELTEFLFSTPMKSLLLYQE